MPIQSRHDFLKAHCTVQQPPQVINYYQQPQPMPICNTSCNLQNPNVIAPIQVLTGDITRQTDGTYWVTGFGGIPISYHARLNTGDVFVFDELYNKLIPKQLADVVNAGISISSNNNSILITGTTTAPILSVNTAGLDLTVPVNTAITNLPNGSIPATKLSGLCSAISSCPINTTIETANSGNVALDFSPLGSSGSARGGKVGIKARPSANLTGNVTIVASNNSNGDQLLISLFEVTNTQLNGFNYIFDGNPLAIGSSYLFVRINGVWEQMM